MSAICKCKSCDCLFSKADIKFKKAVLDDVFQHTGYTAYVLSSIHNAICIIPVFLISISDKTLHCPICEALHLDGFTSV